MHVLNAGRKEPLKHHEHAGNNAEEEHAEEEQAQKEDSQSQKEEEGAQDVVAEGRRRGQLHKCF